ncbi:unnamed protein product, partial [Staurois parvus]
MRRSAAPSRQLLGNPAKKPCFTPPIKHNSFSNKTTDSLTTLLKPKVDNVPSEVHARTCGVDADSKAVELSVSKDQLCRPAVTAVAKFRPLTGMIGIDSLT